MVPDKYCLRLPFINQNFAQFSSFLKLYLPLLLPLCFLISSAAQISNTHFGKVANQLEQARKLINWKNFCIFFGSAAAETNQARKCAFPSSACKKVEHIN